jgi:hypothetical protein
LVAILGAGAVEQREHGVRERAGHAEAAERRTDRADEQALRAGAAHDDASDHQFLAGAHEAARGEVERAADAGVEFVELGKADARAGVRAGNLQGELTGRQVREQRRVFAALGERKRADGFREVGNIVGVGTRFPTAIAGEFAALGRRGCGGRVGRARP